MIVGEVIYRPAVGGDIAFEMPLVAEYVLKQLIVAAARLSVEAVVGTHHTVYLGFHHQFAESGEICVPEVVRGDSGVKHVAVAFRTAVHGIVFGTSHGLQVERMGSFESAHHGRAHFCREVGIFAVCFLSASPARIAEYVYVWSPVGKTAVLRYAITGCKSLVEQRTPFG